MSNLVVSEQDLAFTKQIIKQQVAAWKLDPSRPIRIGPGGWPPLYLTPYHPDLNLPSRIYDSVRQ